MDNFETFIKYEPVDQRIILKYKDELPAELVEVWIKYGFGTLLNGFFKIINPDGYLRKMLYKEQAGNSYLCHCNG